MEQIMWQEQMQQDVQGKVLKQQWVDVSWVFVEISIFHTVI